MLRPLIYLLGVMFFNSKILQCYNFLLKSQYRDIRKTREYQLIKLKELLVHSFEHSRYYRDKFKAVNFHPSELNSLSDMVRIPILSKKDVTCNREDIQIKNSSEKLYYSETSGSTGKPLVFYRNKEWDAWHRASVFRGYSWYGVKPWEKNGYFWGFNYSFKRRLKVRFFDYLQNQFRVFSYKDTELERFIGDLENASYLEGYSSMIYEVAKKVNKGTYKNKSFNLKMIKGTSEKIFDKYQDEVEKAFGKKIISEYGSAEAGIIAFECPNGNMHLNMETVIVEEIDSEIVVTNLVSKSFPIIRYKLGDYIKIDEREKCKCGVNHYIIKEVLGRVGKVIYGILFEYPSLTLYYVFKNLAVENEILLNYQAIQCKKGFLQLNIEQLLKREEVDLLKREFIKYFGSDLVLNLTSGVDIKSIGRKKADFISDI